MEHRPYTYSEILGLKYSFCRCKKNSRYLQYKEHMEVIADRMDVANIIKNECYLDVLNQVLMKPYQLKLISHFKKNKDDETKLAFDIPISGAIDTLI